MFWIDLTNCVGCNGGSCDLNSQSGCPTGYCFNIHVNVILCKDESVNTADGSGIGSATIPTDWGGTLIGDYIPNNDNPNNVSANIDNNHAIIANVKGTEAGVNGDNEDLYVDPCQELSKNDNIEEFSSKMTELKQKAATQNFESAYGIYQNVTNGTSFTGEFNGEIERKEATVSFENGTNHSATDMVAIIHCHLDNGTTFKVFSLSDIIALGEIAKHSTRPSSQFAIYVTTTSGTFAIKVNDVNKLKNNLDLMNANKNNYENGFSEKVKKTDNLETQKLGFLQFINSMHLIGNPGIDLFQKVNSTGKWKKLTLSPDNNNVIQESNCN